MFNDQNPVDTNFPLKSLLMWGLGILAGVGFLLSTFKNLLPRSSKAKPNTEIIVSKSKVDTLIRKLDQIKLDTTIVKNQAVPPTNITPIIWEPFWDFYYRFVREEQFRTLRVKNHYTTAQNDFLAHVMEVGDFVNQDSLSNRWLYTVNYKHEIVTLNFINNQGQWFLESVE